MKNQSFNISLIVAKALFYTYSYLPRKLNNTLAVLECIIKKLNQLRERFKGLRRFIWNRTAASLYPTRFRDPNVHKVASDLRVKTEQRGD